MVRKKNAIVMYSAHNEGKSVVAELKDSLEP